MNVDPMTMARARLAQHKATQAFLFDPNVNLIGIGHPEHDGQIAENELAIRVHVHKKLSGVALEAATAAGYTRPIPSEINGFPTDVLQGTYHPHQWRSWRNWWRPTTNLNERATSIDPMRGGISISDEFRLSYGTLGGKVYDRVTGKEMILSNWHVLAGDWRARQGQLIYQPGRLDGGTFANASAYLARDAMRANLDAAVATLTDGRRLTNEQLGLGLVTSVGHPQLGDAVVKSGRSSYITYGRVVEINSVARMRYGYLERLIRDVMIIDPWNGGEVSRPGDSGSWWLNMPTKQAVGLHFAGSNAPERALAINMQSVLDALNIEIRD
jgi:endonuclease G, mitochondrial